MSIVLSQQGSVRSSFSAAIDIDNMDSSRFNFHDSIVEQLVAVTELPSVSGYFLPVLNWLACFKIISVLLLVFIISLIISLFLDYVYSLVCPSYNFMGLESGEVSNRTATPTMNTSLDVKGSTDLSACLEADFMEEKAMLSDKPIIPGAQMDDSLGPDTDLDMNRNEIDNQKYLGFIEMRSVISRLGLALLIVCRSFESTLTQRSA
jgi:hypothetical protein